MSVFSYNNLIINITQVNYTYFYINTTRYKMVFKGKSVCVAQSLVKRIMNFFCTRYSSFLKSMATLPVLSRKYPH